MVAELRQLPDSKLPWEVSLRVVCVFVALLVSIGNRARALDWPEPVSGYASKNFTVEDGLLSNDVNVILQREMAFYGSALRRDSSALTAGTSRLSSFCRKIRLFL